MKAFLRCYSNDLTPSRALAFARDFLSSLNSSKTLRAAQLMMLEAGEEVAQAAAGAVKQEASPAWFQEVVVELRRVARAAASLGSRHYRQQVFAGKTALTLPGSSSAGSI